MHSSRQLVNAEQSLEDLLALIREINEHRSVIAEHAFYGTGPEGWQAVWDELIEMSTPLDHLRRNLQANYCCIVQIINAARNGDE